MPYTKTIWKDRVVERPMTFTFQNNADGTTTLISAEGTIIETGTPITSSNLNHLETQFEEAINELSIAQMIKLTQDTGNVIDKTNTDPNSLTTTGFYQFNSTAPNMPVSNYGWTLLHIANTSTNAYQVAFMGSTQNRVFYRRMANGTWDTWKEIARLDQVLALTGGTITGTLRNSSAYPLISNYSGRKSFVFHHPSTSDSIILAPSLNINAEDWDWTKQFKFNATGILEAVGFTENGTALSSKYAPLTHTHTIANVTNLQSSLDAKLNTSGGSLSGALTLPAETKINMGAGALRGTTVNMVVSAGSGGAIYLRPNGDADSTGEVRITSAGTILTDGVVDGVLKHKSGVAQYMEIGAYTGKGTGNARIHYDSTYDAGAGITRFWNQLGALSHINAKSLVTTSLREIKANIIDYPKNATEQINATPVYHYHYKEDLRDFQQDENGDWIEVGQKDPNSVKYRTGILVDEAPEEIALGDGIDSYAMSSLMWKAIQELSAEIKALKGTPV